MISRIFLWIVTGLDYSIEDISDLILDYNRGFSKTKNVFLTNVYQHWFKNFPVERAYGTWIIRIFFPSLDCEHANLKEFPWTYTHYKLGFWEYFANLNRTSKVNFKDFFAELYVTITRISWFQKLLTLIGLLETCL